MRAIVLTSVFALALVGEAFAQTAPDAPPVPIQQGTAVVQQDGSVVSGDTSSTDARPDPDAEVICRVIQETGSRLARRRQRVCGTRTMWDTLAEQSAQAVQPSGVNTAPRGN